MISPAALRLNQNASSSSLKRSKSLREPTDEFYGDRSAGLEDSQGNQWWLATHIEDVSPEELAKRAAKAKPGSAS